MGRRSLLSKENDPLPGEGNLLLNDWDSLSTKCDSLSLEGGQFVEGLRFFINLMRSYMGRGRSYVELMRLFVALPLERNSCFISKNKTFFDVKPFFL